MELKYYYVDDCRKGKPPVKIISWPIGNGEELRPCMNPERLCKYTKYQLKEVDSLIRKILYFYTKTWTK